MVHVLLSQGVACTPHCQAQCTISGSQGRDQLCHGEARCAVQSGPGLVTSSAGVLMAHEGRLSLNSGCCYCWPMVLDRMPHYPGWHLSAIARLGSHNHTTMKPMTDGQSATDHNPPICPFWQNACRDVPCVSVAQCLVSHSLPPAAHTKQI